MENNLLKSVSKGLCLVLALTWPALQAPAQDDATQAGGDAKKQKKTRIVIVKDQDGKIVKTDTTIYGDAAYMFDEPGLDEIKEFDFDFDFDFDSGEFDGLDGKHDIRVFGDSGNAFVFKKRIQISDEEKAAFKEEMEKTMKERKKEIEKAMKKLREEIKKLNREDLEKEMEKLHEELMHMKQDLKRNHHKMWIHGEEGSEMRFWNDEEGTRGARKCMVVIEGDSLTGQALRKCCKLKMQCGDKTDKKIRLMKYRTEDQGQPGPAPIIDESPVKQGDAGRVEDKAEAISEQSAQRQTVNKSEASLSVKDLAFYPNPTGGRFSLSFSLDTPGQASIRLMDFAGRELLNETANAFPGRYEKQFDISGSARGSYLLMISQGSRWIHEKLVVQ